MKNYNLYRNLLQGAFVAVLIAFTYSCINSKKEEVPAPTVQEQNEATLDGTNKETDAKFIVKATEISLAEIQLGQLAQKLGSSQCTRDLGKMMETEHTKSLAEITELAKSKEVTVPVTQTFDAQDAYNKLNAKSSTEFDKMYADMMVDGHKGAITIFEKACNESTDVDVRDWATKVLPALKMHLQHAQACQSENNKK